MVQRLAQAVDNGNGLADQLPFLGNRLPLDGAAGLGDAFQSALHEHLDQAVRAGLEHFALDADPLVLLHGAHGVHGMNLLVDS
ncbi:hypothetical protein D3C80_2023340 [compost metagenome]